METRTDIMQWELSYSDNSHIFGKPIRIVEGFADGFMDIPIIHGGERSFEELREWNARVFFLEKAGIDMHLRYREVNDETLET